jgi:hypothetical protein
MPRLALVSAVVGGLVLSGLGSVPAAAAGTITCTILAPGNPVVTAMDTPVAGLVQCVNSSGSPVTMSIAPYVADQAGPFSGKLAFNPATGDFLYTPGFYPPDPVTGKVDKLPEYSGPDSFIVLASSPDGASASFEVPIQIQAPPRACDPGFAAQTRTMFNDPSGSEAKQYQMLRYLIAMIDCTPPLNPDGTQATIKFSF